MNRFSKKCTALLVAGALTCTLTANVWAMGSLDHFKTVSAYTNTTFSDVSGWYADYVETCYELGLFSGTATGQLFPRRQHDRGRSSEAGRLPAQHL